MSKNYKILNSDDAVRLQEKQLEMLIEFVEICKALKLRYFLIGGTALGAVRHKGFIPWDDDIDVAMPRKDYEIFLEKAPSFISESYFIQTFKSDPLYPNNFAKIRNNNTAFIEYTVHHINMNHGIYIDIFPLDGASNSKIDKIKNKIFTNKISQIFDMSQYKTKSNALKKIIKKVSNLLLFKYSYVEVVDKREKLYKKYDYDNSEMIANYSGAWGEKEIVPKSYFGKGKKAKFENIEVIIPEKYDEYLSQLYGNYMKLPPVEKRVTHHYCSVIDLNHSYEIYF